MLNLLMVIAGVQHGGDSVEARGVALLQYYNAVPFVIADPLMLLIYKFFMFATLRK